MLDARRGAQSAAVDEYLSAVQRLAEALAPVLESLEASRDWLAEAGETPSGSVAKGADTLNSLRAALENFDPRARDYALQLREAGGANELDQVLAQILTHIDNFDFASAMSLLSEHESALSRCGGDHA